MNKYKKKRKKEAVSVLEVRWKSHVCISTQRFQLYILWDKFGSDIILGLSHERIDESRGDMNKTIVLMAQ